MAESVKKLHLVRNKDIKENGAGGFIRLLGAMKGQRVGDVKELNCCLLLQCKMYSSFLAYLATRVGQITCRVYLVLCISLAL